VLASIAVSPLGVVTAFAAGFASFVSPCVLPLVPPYLSFISGVAYGDLKDNARRVTLATTFFVAGFTTMFTAFGASVGWAGSLIAEHKRTIEVAGGIFVIVMGAALLGFGSRVFGREWRLHPGARRASLASAYATGAAFAVGWTPCIGPVLTAILTFAGTSGPAQGAILLGAYSLGLGVPFLIAGLATSSTLNVLGVFKRHGGLVNRISGLVLIGVGILLATGELTRITAQLQS
jgi:cytochrome c-type biogenesis protein